MKTIEIKLYSFDELSEQAKDKAIENTRNNDGYLDYEWWDSVYEDYKENIIAEYFNVTKMYFRGFWSQGDGAMFEYDGITDKLFNDFVDSLDLSPMRKQWLKTQGYVSAQGRQSGHYCHEKSCSHSINLEPDFSWQSAENFANWIESFQDDFEEYVKDEYVELACSLYSALEKEYNHLTSDEAIKEHLIINEYLFTEEGEVY